ncbi:SDR family oxidoreductase [Desertibacillus haloalkaliphilus]|uniref:SDR family oxidoreductase n=1 Tax=Desertibacillus haloalkaliphilus TaxID=1328930 RepID=UPI001C25D94B|nr:SDR family oxidoreductase [Desertibacillus haloalkaliphilus]MBU8907597.1 SDR family oxidoreductase [Desertibacillus haloalkaliphilus]
MRVLVVGANGQIGKHIVRILGESNKHEVRAMIRKQEQSAALEAVGAETVIADLEGDVKGIAEAAKGCDAVIFTAGSGAHTGADKTILIDLDGAIKTIEAAEQAQANRFVMVSAINADKREKWSEQIRHYHAAKHYADERLKASDLNYTIVRPGGLTNDPGTGKVSIAKNLERGYVTREDVASTVVATLEEENTYRRGFDLIGGDTAIAEALQQFK